MRNNQRTVLVFLLLLTFTVITAMAAFQMRSQEKNQVSQEEATPVQVGVMTPKQAEHSKLYTRTPRLKKITDSPEGRTIIIGLPWSDRSVKNVTFDHYLQEFACKADAIVVARVRSRASQLTTDESFIFSDYELTVEDVLKNNPAANVKSKQDITVTRRGGVVILNGKILAVKDRSFKALETSKTYLLLLSYLPSTASYEPLNSESSFEISDRQLLRLTDEEPSYPISSMKDSKTVINQIRTLGINCDNSGGEN